MSKKLVKKNETSKKIPKKEIKRYDELEPKPILLKESKLLTPDDDYVKHIENEAASRGGIIFDPKNGNLNINDEMFTLPYDISEVPSPDLGNMLNAFTQQKIYLRTAIMRVSIEMEYLKREYFQVSENIFNEMTTKRVSESAKDRIISTNSTTKEAYNKYNDKRYLLKYMETMLLNIEDSIFLISREISRRGSDMTDEGRADNVNRR